MCMRKLSVNVTASKAGDRTFNGWVVGLQRFSGDNKGQVAIIFGLMTFIICGIVGGAIDVGRWVSARNQTQAAIDAALLAAGRTAQTTYGDKTAAVAAANAYYAQMKSHLVVNDTIAFASNSTATSFTASGQAYVVTPFLQFACPQLIYGCQDNPLSTLPVIDLSDSKHAESTIAQGGNSGSSVEIGLMLDTTGSMGGQKIIDLKAAAKDLVDIVVWDDQGTYTSRIGIAPFSQAVNVGDYFQAVTNENPLRVTHDVTTTTQTGTTTTYNYPASCYTNGKLKSSCKNNSAYAVVTPVYTTTTTTVVDNLARSKCVVERTGTAEFTDTVPGSGTWVKSLYAALVSQGTSTSSASSATCPESAPIVPLTSNKTTLKASIDCLVAQNSTAGAVGTAWAWYLISPDWGTIFTGASKPESYSKLTELGPSGLPRLQKIAILMTDGGYNYWQDASASVTTVNPKALSLCSGMKAKGIKVYTVGFDLGTDTTAKNMLKSCASDATYFYDAANGDALKAAFRDIALKISNLRISH